MTPAKHLLRCHAVATMTDAALVDVDILIEGTAIAGVGRDLRDTEAVEHDYRGCIAIPAMINAHCHLELSTQSPAAYSGDFADWLHERATTPRTDHDVRQGLLAGVRQSMGFGVGCVCDITTRPGMTRELLAEQPIDVISYGEVIGLGGAPEITESMIASAGGSCDSSRVHPGVSPHAPYTVSERYYRQCLDTGLPVTSHIAESLDEAAFLAKHAGPFRQLWERLGKWHDPRTRSAGGPIGFAQHIGLLNHRSADGVPALLAHVNYANDDELQLLKRGSAAVVYCPRTHTYFNHPPHRWREMLEMGIDVLVGTDSCASSPDLNLLDDLRLVQQQAPEMPAIDLLALATSKPAKLLQRPDLGIIAPGGRAGVAIYPADSLEQLLHEPVHPYAVWLNGDLQPLE